MIFSKPPEAPGNHQRRNIPNNVPLPLLRILSGLLLSICLLAPSFSRGAKSEKWSEVKDQVEREHAEKLKRADTFEPKDDMAHLYGGPEHLVVVYMRRIEFFNIPQGVKVVADPNKAPINQGPYGTMWCGVPGRPIFLEGKRRIELKPHKVLRFTYTIDSLSEGLVVGEIEYPCRYLLVATNMNRPLAITRYSDWDEWELIRLRPNREWHTPKGDYDEFYGMFEMDGDLVFRANETAHMPDKWIRNWHISANGDVAVFAIGHSVEADELTGLGNYGCVKQVIMWMKDRGVENIPLKEAIRRYPLLEKAEGIQWTLPRPECK